MAIQPTGPITVEVHDAPEYLIGLACGHFWPGSASSDDEARFGMELFRVTGDSAKCPRCGQQEKVTGPLARVLEA